MQMINVSSKREMENSMQPYLMTGFTLQYQSSDKIVLIKKNEISWLIAAGLFFFTFIGFFIYLAVYANKKDQMVTINNEESLKAA